jgi:predicted transcriptional regulator
MDGRMVGMTPWQNKVYQLAMTYVDHGTVTMRSMAMTLKCSPSTVSRALVKLMSWGLIGYMTGRGRYAGALIFRMTKGDPFQRFRDAAKARVRQWSEAAQRRVSRLAINVAPYILEKERGVDSLYYYLTSITSTKDATLSRPWTAEDVAGVE